MAKKKLNVDNLPSNSMASKAIPIREEVTSDTTDVVVKRKPAGRKSAPVSVAKKKGFVESIASMFVSKEPQNIALYILEDVLAPALKSLIQDIVTNSIEMLLYGESKGGGKSRNRDDRNVVSYNRYFKGADKKEGKARTTRERLHIDDIFFRHGQEADEVLEILVQMAEQYEQVTVADYYEAAGVDGATWAHHNYGWDDASLLKRAYCTHTVDGYKIVLPKPIPLD